MGKMAQKEQLKFGEAEVQETSTRVFVAYIEMGGMRLPVGALSVDRQNLSVELVFVQRQFRRQGVGRQLLEAVRASLGNDLSDTGYRSLSGEVWGLAVGLKSGGERRELSAAEAEGRGNGLMIPLYTAQVTELAAPEEMEKDAL